MTDDLLAIGAFAARSRLSPKALRLYDRLGLLAPAYVDETTGYRYYRADQVERARTVALLRRLDMPLTRIAEVVAAGEGTGLRRGRGRGVGPSAGRGRAPARRQRSSGGHGVPRGSWYGAARR